MSQREKKKTKGRKIIRQFHLITWREMKLELRGGLKPRASEWVVTWGAHEDMREAHSREEREMRCSGLNVNPRSSSEWGSRCRAVQQLLDAWHTSATTRAGKERSDGPHGYLYNCHRTKEYPVWYQWIELLNEAGWFGIGLDCSWLGL